jgi:leucyl-tRNA synthetase
VNATSATTKNVAKPKGDNVKEVKEVVKDSKLAAPAPKSFARRDHLRKNEIEVQQRWADNKTYEASVQPDKPKFFVTFPYPYMNGKLHLGHAFSLTKAEFAARFKRLQGMNVLWPFAFHCTGNALLDITE